MRSLFLILALICAQSAAAETPSTLATGAWASGDTAAACETAPITLMMSDGVVAVFLSKDGELHSLGSWAITADTLTMTHNDFPLSGDGQSKPPVELDILELSETHFVTRNAEGAERARVRCPSIKLTQGHAHYGHRNQ